MDKTDKQPVYTVLSKTEIDAAIEKIISECKDLESYEEIKKVMHDAFYNMLYLAQNCESWDRLKVYRVTTMYEGLDPLKVSSFSHPPSEKTKRGRANIQGSPVFYCSLNPNTALHEMKEDLTTGSIYYVSEWEINADKNIFYHPLIFNSKTMDNNSPMSDIVNQQMKTVFSGSMFADLQPELVESLQYLFLKVGDLFTLPTSDYYKITSTHAHNVLPISMNMSFPINQLS